MKSKPSNLKYTDLCIYIDNTVYERDENNNPIGLRRLTSIEEETVYNYLYNIIIALAHKKKLFPYKDVNQYNDFSSMFATKLYMRITSQKQDFSNTRSRMRPIKSVLNLIKKVIGYAAIDFRNDNYQQILNPEYDELEKIDTVSEYSQDIIRSQYERPQHEIFIYVFVDIAKYVDKVVNKSFFNRNKRESSNLKLSVLLSIERFVTLPHNIKNKSTPKKAKLLQKQVDNWRDYIIIWDEENSYITKELIALYIQYVFSAMLNEVEDEKAYDTLPTDIINDILRSALPTYSMNQTEED